MTFFGSSEELPHTEYSNQYPNQSPTNSANSANSEDPVMHSKWGPYSQWPLSIITSSCAVCTCTRSPLYAPSSRHVFRYPSVRLSARPVSTLQVKYDGSGSGTSTGTRVTSVYSDTTIRASPTRSEVASYDTVVYDSDPTTRTYLYSDQMAQYVSMFHLIPTTSIHYVLAPTSLPYIPRSNALYIAILRTVRSNYFHRQE